VFEHKNINANHNSLKHYYTNFNHNIPFWDKIRYTYNKDILYNICGEENKREKSLSKLNSFKINNFDTSKYIKTKNCTITLSSIEEINCVAKVLKMKREEDINHIQEKYKDADKLLSVLDQKWRDNYISNGKIKGGYKIYVYKGFRYSFTLQEAINYVQGCNKRRENIKNILEWVYQFEHTPAHWEKEYIYSGLLPGHALTEKESEMYLRELQYSKIDNNKKIYLNKIFTKFYTNYTQNGIFVVRDRQVNISIKNVDKIAERYKEIEQFDTEADQSYGKFTEDTKLTYYITGKLNIYSKSYRSIEQYKEFVDLQIDRFLDKLSLEERICGLYLNTRYRVSIREHKYVYVKNYGKLIDGYQFCDIAKKVYRDRVYEINTLLKEVPGAERILNIYTSEWKNTHLIGYKIVGAIGGVPIGIDYSSLRELYRKVEEIYTIHKEYIKLTDAHKNILKKIRKNFYINYGYNVVYPNCTYSWIIDYREKQYNSTLEDIIDKYKQDKYRNLLFTERSKLSKCFTNFDKNYLEKGIFVFKEQVFNTTLENAIKIAKRDEEVVKLIDNNYFYSISENFTVKINVPKIRVYLTEQQIYEYTIKGVLTKENIEDCHSIQSYVTTIYKYRINLIFHKILERVNREYKQLYYIVKDILNQVYINTFIRTCDNETKAVDKLIRDANDIYIKNIERLENISVEERTENSKCLSYDWEEEIINTGNYGDEQWKEKYKDWEEWEQLEEKYLEKLYPDKIYNYDTEKLFGSDFSSDSVIDYKSLWPKEVLNKYNIYESKFCPSN